MTVCTEAALRHLRSVRPLDGWSIESKGPQQHRLCCRNVPLTDNFFLDIYYTGNGGSVVGILTLPRNSVSDTAQAQVLVDPRGQLTGRKVALVKVAGYNPSRPANKSSSTTAPRRNDTTTTDATQQFTDDENKQLLQYAGMAVVGLMLLRALTFAAVGLYFLVPPLLYFYLLKTCPPQSSFDAKREVKRVLRGHHLPDDHPDKPKGLFGETLARVNATLATELATGLAGYEVSIMPLAGAALLASVRVPAVQTDFYWVGAAERWCYMYSNNYGQDKAHAKRE